MRIRSACALYSLMLAVAGGTLLQAQIADPLRQLLGVSTQPDGQGGLEMVLRNNSSKDIAGWAIETYFVENGNLRSAGIVTLDLVTGYAAARHGTTNVSKYEHLGPLAAGRDMFYFAPSKEPVAIVVRAIAFDDNTVAGDNELMRLNFDRHAAMAAELDGVTAKLRGLQVDLRGGIAAWAADAQLRGYRLAGPPNPRSPSVARTQEFEILDSFARQALQPDSVLAAQVQERLSYFADQAAVLRQHARIEPAR